MHMIAFIHAFMKIRTNAGHLSERYLSHGYKNRSHQTDVPPLPVEHGPHGPRRERGRQGRIREQVEITDDNKDGLLLLSSSLAVAAQRGGGPQAAQRGGAHPILRARIAAGGALRCTQSLFLTTGGGLEG
jgi:hypothetical protein